MKDLIYLKDVVTLRVDSDKCTGCSMCLEVCPHGVLAIDEKRVLIRNRDACMECGACSLNCPVGAVSVEAGVGCAANHTSTSREPPNTTHASASVLSLIHI